MNALEEHALKLMRRDPLGEAEEIVGEANRDASALGFVLLQALSAEKEDVFSVLGDTHFHMKYAEYVQTLERNGFEKIYTETHGEKNDVYEIWWHKDGFLLTSESYDQKHLNMAQVYYNWMPNSVEASCAIRQSGGYAAPGVWSGHSDGREGLFTHLKQLRENGQVLQNWVEPPFLWLVNYTESKVEGYSYEAINKMKFVVLPEHVQRAIGPIK